MQETIIKEYLGIIIDYSRDKNFSISGLSRLKEGYMLPNESSPQERFAYVATQFSSNKDHAQRMYDYMSNFWLSCSTPILSYGTSKKSLPISCFASYLDDTIESIFSVSNETRTMAVSGGGVGVHVNLRPGDKKSSGIIPHLRTYDADVSAFKQNSSRRGATAVYLDINHPEIYEFIEMRKPTGGDENRKCLNIHHAVNISDDFMHRIYELSTNDNLTNEQKQELDRYDLINPNTNEVATTVSARDLWSRLIMTRMETGEPYCHFIDHANASLPDYQKEQGLKINGSNLCIEMALATNITRSLVCCLASINLEKYDEIKPHIKKFISDVVEFLDNVLQVFIDKTKDIPEFDKARNCAINERPLGIGALGWHSYLQSKNIPIESVMAVSINNSIWSEIKANAVEASERLAEERGCIPDILNSKIPNLKPRRNSHLLALAPNAASSYILNTSPSCEPYRACFYAEKGTNGLVIHKNKYLDKIIREKEGVDYDDVWREIIAAEGILKNIDCLTDLEKDVFKSFPEIAQEWIIELAADRQKYICQGQSTNLAFFPTEHVAVVHNIHLLAWKKGLKGLYYCRSDSLRKADKVGQKVIREKIESLEELNKQEEVCLACQ